MNPKKHRHFIALPAFVLALLLTAGLSSALPLRAETGADSVRFTADSDDLPFQIGTTVSGVLHPHATLTADRDGTHLTLVRGQAIIHPAGFTQISVGAATVYALGHPIVALLNGTQVTIAPIAAPSLVSFGENSRALGPGQQLRIDAAGHGVRSAVPSDWYAAQASEIASLAPVAPATKDEGLMQAIDGRMTAEKLTSMTGSAAVLDATGHALRLALLSLVQSGGRMSDADGEAYVKLLQDDPTLLRDIVLLMPIMAQTILQPMPTALLQAWPDGIVEAVLGHSSDEALQAIHDASVLPHALESAGFPKQAMLWRDALAHSISLLKTVVTPEQAARLRADATTTALGSLPQPSAPEPIVPTPTTHWSAEQLIALTHEALVKQGAMLASTTSFVADTENQVVAVENVFVAEGGEDVPYAFTYDPAADEVSHIVRNGVSQPNAVPAATFFHNEKSPK